MREIASTALLVGSYSKRSLVNVKRQDGTTPLSELSRKPRLSSDDSWHIVVGIGPVSELLNRPKRVRFGASEVGIEPESELFANTKLVRYSSSPVLGTEPVKALSEARLEKFMNDSVSV